MSVVSHLPRARYLLKVAEEEGASQIARLLQRQGLQCVVEKNHVVVSADPAILKSQARLLLRISSFLTCFISRARSDHLLLPVSPRLRN
jgi:hypothetical protein